MSFRSALRFCAEGVNLLGETLGSEPSPAICGGPPISSGFPVAVVLWGVARGRGAGDWGFWTDL